jgi:hypothetical protein
MSYNREDLKVPIAIWITKFAKLKNWYSFLCDLIGKFCVLCGKRISVSTSLSGFTDPLGFKFLKSDHFRHNVWSPVITCQECISFLVIYKFLAVPVKGQLSPA